VQRCSRLNVVAQQAAVSVPPAWNKRVVVPEVQPRDTPKVRKRAVYCLCSPAIQHACSSTRLYHCWLSIIHPDVAPLTDARDADEHCICTALFQASCTTVQTCAEHGLCLQPGQDFQRSVAASAAYITAMHTH
jgi:hypothetical protein